MYLVRLPDQLELLHDLGALVQFQHDTCRADAEGGHVVRQALEGDEAGVGRGEGAWTGECKDVQYIMLFNCTGLFAPRRSA